MIEEKPVLERHQLMIKVGPIREMPLLHFGEWSGGECNIDNYDLLARVYSLHGITGVLAVGVAIGLERR